MGGVDGRLTGYLSQLERLLAQRERKKTFLRVKPQDASSPLPPFCIAHPPQKLLMDDPLSHYSKFIRADRVFGPGSGNHEIAKTLDYLAYAVTKNEDAVVVACGASGSGKSHSLFGAESDGVAFILMDHLMQFSHLLLPGETNFSIKMAEITDRGLYFDLLTDYEKTPVEAGPGAVDSLTEIPVDSVNLVAEWIEQGFTFVTNLPIDLVGAPHAPRSSVALFFIVETVFEGSHFRSSLSFLDSLDVSLMIGQPEIPLSRLILHSPFPPPASDPAASSAVEGGEAGTASAPAKAALPSSSEAAPPIPIPPPSPLLQKDSVLGALFNPDAHSCFLFTLESELNRTAETLQTLYVAGLHGYFTPLPLPRPSSQTAAMMQSDNQLLLDAVAKGLADFGMLRRVLESNLRLEMRLKLDEVVDRALETTSVECLIPWAEAKAQSASEASVLSETVTIGTSQTKLLDGRLRRLQAQVDSSSRLASEFQRLNQDVDAMIPELRVCRDEFDLKWQMAANYVAENGLMVKLPDVASESIERIYESRQMRARFGLQSPRNKSTTAALSKKTPKHSRKNSTVGGKGSALGSPSRPRGTNRSL